MELVIEWAKAFLLTVLVEIPIAAFVLRRDERSLGRLAAIIFFASLATHPAVWFICPRLPLSYSTMVAVAEAWAVVIESIFYWIVLRGIDPLRAAGVSLLANGASFGVGLVLRALTGWV